MKNEDGTECSETLTHKIQTPGNYPEENIQNPCYFSEHKSHMEQDEIQASVVGQCQLTA